jgi:hypothetical protein
MNEAKGNWSRLIIQNPDYLIVKKSIINDIQYYLRPDENIRRICFSDKSEDIVICNLLTSKIVKAIQNGENILLDPFYVFHMAHKMSPYEIRGTSFLFPLFDLLMQKNREPEVILKIRNTLFDIMSFEKKSIAKDVLMTRYLLLIDILEEWFNTKMLMPISKIQGMPCPEVKFDRVKLKKIINKMK